MKLSKLIWMLMFSLLLTGCFSSVKLKPTYSYLINTLPENVAVRRAHAGTILVVAPDTREAFDTTQMAYSSSRYQVAYYGYNQWAETPGQMLQPLIVQSLQNTRHYYAVVVPPFGGQYNYTLRTKILDWRQDYTQSQPMFRVVIRAQMINALTGRVLATKLITVSEPIKQCTPYSGVRAGNLAVARALKQLTKFATSVA